MCATTLICWAGFIVVLFRFDPTVSGISAFLFFFVSLFFASWGTLSVSGVLLRLLIHRKMLPYQHIGISLRQALWFSIMLCMSLFLLMQGLFTWWLILILFIGLLSFEFVFLTRRMQKEKIQTKGKTSYHRRKQAQR